jgi:hypothetical protein
VLLIRADDGHWSAAASNSQVRHGELEMTAFNRNSHVTSTAAFADNWTQARDKVLLFLKVLLVSYLHPCVTVDDGSSSYAP